MKTRYVLVSAEVNKSNELVKKVNELLDKNYKLYGDPQISTHTIAIESGGPPEEIDTIYQAMIKES